MKADETQDHLFVQAASSLVDLWPALLTGLGAVVLALPALAQDDGHLALPAHPSTGLVLGLGALMTLVGVVFGALKQKRIRPLESDLASARQEKKQSLEALEILGRMELRVIGAELKYWSAERISLFAWMGNDFTLVARDCLNPRYENAGRRRYPPGFGCLWEAWQHHVGSLVVDVRRSHDEPGWSRQHVDSGLTEEQAHALSMPVRTVIARRVDDPRTGHTPLGVIVFESESVASATAAELDPEAVCTSLKPYFGRLSGVLSVHNKLENDEQPED